LKIADAFSGEEDFYSKDMSFEEIKDVIKKYDDGDYKVFNQELDSMDKSVLLEQYKIFLQTSEDLVARRQNVNNFYISINSALMATFGVIWALEILPFYKFAIGALLALVGMILSISWIKLLESYGNLNSSKMKILGMLEKKLSASLFDAEWEAMSSKYNKKKYVSFSERERQLPIIFNCMFIAVDVICAVILALNFLR
jgi:hypothetical protein